MTILNLFVGSGSSLRIGQLNVDVSVSESHEFSADVTENPVEEGASVTDHVQVKPVRITIEGLVSDTPIAFFFAGGSNVFNGAIGTENNNSTLKAYNELTKILRAREPIAIQTGLALYENMIMTSLSVPRNNRTGKALRFTANFVEVRIVSTIEAVIPARAVKKTGITSVKKDLGKKTSNSTAPNPTNPNAPTDNGSILSRLTGLRG